MSVFEAPISYKKGHVIFAEGESSRFLYLIKSGEVGIFKEREKQLIPIATIGSQDFVGELGIFNEGKRTASAITLEDTLIYMVKKSDIHNILKKCPDWMSNIMINMADRLRSTTNLLRENQLVDEVFLRDKKMTPKDLNKYWNLIQDYKKGRNLA